MRPAQGVVVRPKLGWVLSLRLWGVVALAAASYGAALVAPVAFVAPAFVAGTGALMGLLSLRRDSGGKALDESRFSVGQMLERQIQKGRRISIQDPITGVLQKWYFDLRLSEEIDRCKRYGVPMALLRVGAPLNSTNRDPWGSSDREWQLAQAVSRRLRAVDIAARIAGLEFIICLPHTDLKGAEVAAKRLHEDLKGWSLSVAIATYPEDGEDVRGLIDTALTRAPAEWPEPVEIQELPARRKYGEIISELKAGEEAEIPLIDAETAKLVKQRLRRASKRVNVPLTIWEKNGHVFCKRGEEGAGASQAA